MDHQIIQIKNDVNGNPRRIIHFLAFTTQDERQSEISAHDLYTMVLSKVRKYGGKKFNNKQFGGGVVFQAYGDHEIHEIVDKVISGI